MVSEAEAAASRLQKEYGGGQASAENVATHGNVAFCQRSPLYANGQDTAASTLATLAEGAKLTTVDVKAPGSAALSVCKSLIAGGVAGGVAILWLYRRQSGHEDAELTPVLCLGAGACAGIIAMSATYPMDMVRGRLTVQTDDSPTRYRGMFHAASTIVKEEGPRALYKGSLVIGVVPYVGLNFAVYESLKDWIAKKNKAGTGEDSELGVLTKLGCGAAAGMVGQTVAYPLDVVRRRMQMVGWKGASAIITADGQLQAPVQYAGMTDAFRQTVKNEGFGALYKGLLPNSVKVVPSIALAFVTYEIVKDLLGVELRISE